MPNVFRKIKGTDGVTRDVGSTWELVNDKPEAFPPSSHNHDDRYYTETEIDEKLQTLETEKISLDRLPQGALERLVKVADDTARFALTTDDVQLGDTVQTLDNGLMYVVVDDTKLDSADGYAVYTAGSATSVPWTGVTDKPAIKAGTGKNSIVANDGMDASGDGAFALGDGATAKGPYSVAEGITTQASGVASHAEGEITIAAARGSHAEGYYNAAAGEYAHAEGYHNAASGKYAHVEGSYNFASSENQHVSGKYNIVDSEGTYAEIIGNGAADDARSNARTLDWNGNETLAGKLTVGAAPTEDMDVATKKYVDSASPAVMTGATAEAAGTSGTVPAPAAGDQEKFLKGDGTWGEAGSENTLITDEQADTWIDDAFNHEYTVNFYNGDTLLKTVTVRDGEDADYGDTSELKSSTGASFKEWDPSPVNVQDNLDCHAKFKNGKAKFASIKELQKRDDYYQSKSGDFISFQRATRDQYDNAKILGTSVISSNDSETPIYGWTDSNMNYYWYADADDVYLNEDSSDLFSGHTGLKSIDLSQINTSNVVTMNNMFKGCYSLASLDLSSFDTSNVTDMGGMFSLLDYNWPSSLKTIDISSFDTSNVTIMDNMFYGHAKLSAIIVGDKWNVSNVTNSLNMFLNNISLPNYNSKETDISMAKSVSEGGYLINKATDIIPYTVHFDKNKDTATGTMADQAFAAGEKKALALNAFTDSDFGFKYWNLSADGTDRSFDDGQEVQYLGYKGKETVNLYAIWANKNIQYSHTSNINDDGVASDAYSDNFENNDIVKLVGAKTIHIKVWYSTKGHDWLAIYPAGITPTSDNYDQASISNGKLSGGNSKSTKKDDATVAEFDVTGDTAQFYFHSGWSGPFGSYSPYGYYAVITKTS